LTEVFANVDLEGFLEYLFKAKSEGRDYNESLADAYKIYYSEIYWMFAKDFESEAEMRKSLIKSMNKKAP
jgi:5'-deoxynucleotidase YfbR-like HD superfamily hydrolase